MDNRYRNDNNQNDKTGVVMSWVIIFILLFVFWPVGLILLFKKMRGYSKPVERNINTGAVNNRYTASAGPMHVQQPTVQGSMQGQQTNVQHPIYGQQAAGSPSKPIQNAMPVVNNIKRPNKLQKKTGRFISVVLLLISISMIITGLAGFASAIGQSSGFLGISLVDSIMFSFFLFGGIGTFLSRNVVKHRYTRYKNYYAFINGRGVVPLSDLMQVAGAPLNAVKRDIQAMINNSYLESGAYIDYELECLVLSAEDAEKLRMDIRGTQNILQLSDDEPADQAIMILAELREVNLLIFDETISDRVHRLEEIAAMIFKTVEENPEKKQQIRRFESYYLPTTLKLVRSYATLEKQGVKGENILSAKQSIRNILDTLTTGYEQQLDQLFKSDAIDIAADISVLENLMQQDGLTNDKSEFQVLEF